MPKLRLRHLSFFAFLSLACGGQPHTADTPSSVETGPDDSSSESAPPGASQQDAVGEANRLPKLAGPDAAGAYHILLNRPARPGMVRRHHTLASDQRLSVLSVGGKVAEREELRLRVEFVAKQRVLTVDPKGRTTKSEFTVERFVADDARGGEPVLKPGTVFTVAKSDDGEPNITVQGGARLSPQQLVAIRLVTSGRKGGPSADDIFGTDQPQKPGASWPVNAPLAASDLRRTGFIADAKGVDGQTTFLGVREEGGVPSMELVSEAKVTARDFTGLPPGSQVDRAIMHAKHIGLLPLELALPTLRESTSLSVEVRATLPTKGGKGTLEVSGLRSSETRYDMLKR